MKKLLLGSALLATVLSTRASAYVEALYSVQMVLNESFVIAEGKVESHDPQKKIATLKVGKSLKGKCTYDVIRLTYGGGQFWHPEAIPKHLVKDAPVIIFYNEARQAEIYLNRFFFQLYGDAGAPPDKAWWSMTHIEIHMNRTFNGPCEEFLDVVTKSLAGKIKPPPADPKVPVISLNDTKALPVFGEAVDETKLPPSFTKKAQKPLAKPRDPENPAKVDKGLSFQYFEGAWQALPDFDKLTPVKSGVYERPVRDAANRPENYGLRFTGFITIPKEGVYTFTTASNDGSKLFIGSTQVVNNDHYHGTVEESGEINLKAGKHAFTVIYYQAGGAQALEVFWEGPDLGKQPIPATAFSRVIP